MSDQVAVRPVINHVAISVDAAILDDAGRASLVDFFGAVFVGPKVTTAPNRAIR